jgi:5,6-dimethylbenzimidazole synthase
MTETPPPLPRHFDQPFRDAFRDLVLWRRDVRRFRRDPIDPALIQSLIELASHAPSVGHSQPWRFVLVESAERRDAVKSSFIRANAKALESYDGEQRTQYAGLKLEGLEEAPVHLAVFADETTDAGSGLGRRTMPETVRYSAVAAVQILWLAARAEGLGLGWISILEPEIVSKTLDVPESWTLVAYLCIGRPVEEHLDPELDRYRWQPRLDNTQTIFKR